MTLLVHNLRQLVGQYRSKKLFSEKAMLQLHDPRLDLITEGKQEDEIGTQVWELLGATYPQQHLLERRREKRYPFPNLIHLTPLGDDGLTPADKSISVVGKHLSQHGLGFYHTKPLAHRRMIASLECNGHWLGFIIELRWCRFTKQGWYESGGRFLQTIDSPITDEDQLTPPEDW
ncbi:MAG: hypothetical protein ACWGMZ_12005 [Thermoguttaceae bacterium]